MTFHDLDAHFRKLEALSHAQAMLGVDEAVMMPEGGGEKRAEAMATLAAIRHDMASAPVVGEWLDRATPSNDQQVAAITEAKREFVNLTCISSAFVKEQVEARISCEQLWRRLRPSGDWPALVPSLERVVQLAREEAAMRSDALGMAPYDALIDQYDPGSKSATIEKIFTALKLFLVDFVPRALDAQNRRRAMRPLKPFQATFSVDSQKRLGQDLMSSIGFDFHHGRLDVSHHPFCGGVPTDVRMTTRYRQDEFLSSLMGILHETGHGLYEQGLPKGWLHWAAGAARGMMLHESQSLFVEMQIARSPAFWEFALPIAKKHLALDDWTAEDVVQHVHHVERGFIRVEADEVTYPLHVILRFEIERDLIEGKIEVRDIPEIWDQKMQDYLGLSTQDNPKDGPMQDVHWPGGAFGYFPSYTLGALTAAQIRKTMEISLPDVEEQIRRGEFAAIKTWLSQNIWAKASFLSTEDLLVSATGSTLSAEHYIQHVERRYLS
jgi:carboxypeptidase Taq